MVVITTAIGITIDAEEDLSLSYSLTLGMLYSTILMIIIYMDIYLDHPYSRG